MKTVEISRSAVMSLFVPPTALYNEIRLHHCLLVWGGWQLVTSSTLYRKVSEQILRVLSGLSESFLPLIQRGLIPDGVIRWGIRLQLRDHLNILRAENVEQELQNKMTIITKLKQSPIAINTDQANEQHYEVPAKFYDLCLGPKKKYSSGYWPTKAKMSMEESELAMLNRYCELANVQDGMSIVDLGCGWGSLTLHLAEKYPNAKITGISNSNSQREYILATAKARGYNVGNITIITCNVANDQGALEDVKNNDLVMTVEM
jgi:cyclopropane-fatty-acyl-phospholipid synthase